MRSRIMFHSCLFQVVFVAMARFFMLINSCINPFIYASTLPAFKQIVKGYALCKFEVVLEGLREIRTPRMGRKAHDVKNTVSHKNLQSL